MERLKKLLQEAAGAPDHGKDFTVLDFTVLDFKLFDSRVKVVLRQAEADMPQVKRGAIAGPSVAATLHDDLQDLVDQLKAHF